MFFIRHYDSGGVRTGHQRSITLSEKLQRVPFMGSWYSFRHKTFEQFDIELSIGGKALGEVAMQNINNTLVTLCYFIMLDYIFNHG